MVIEVHLNEFLITACENYTKTKLKEAVLRRKISGGLGGTRTLDQRLKRPLLYRLSYQPTDVSLEVLEGGPANEVTVTLSDGVTLGKPT